MFFRKRTSPTKIQFGGNGTGKHMLCFPASETECNCLKAFCQNCQEQKPDFMVLDDAKEQKVIMIEKGLYDAYQANQKRAE